MIEGGGESLEPLFRHDAVRHATRRLEGDVLLPTRVSIWVIGGLLTAAMAFAIWYAATATYARKETVVGWLTTDSGVLRAIAERGGLVAEIHVKVGDRVRVRSPVVEMRLLDRTDAQQAGALLAQALAEQRQAIEDKVQASLRRLAIDTRRYTERRSFLEAEIGETGSQIDLQSQRVALAKENLERATALARAGHLSRSDEQTTAAAFVEAQQALSSLKRSAKALEREAVDVSRQVQAIPAMEAAAEAEAASSLAVLNERTTRTGMEIEYAVASPIDGRVEAVPVHPGQSLRPGATVAVITAAGADLEAELFVPSRAAGFVAVGQTVGLKFEAFPFERFGIQEATVKELSLAPLAPDETNIPGLQLQEPVFRVSARLTAQRLSAYGVEVPLRTGMLLTADLVADRRTLMEWLLDPLYAVGRR